MSRMQKEVVMRTPKATNSDKSRQLTVKQLNAIDLLAQGFPDGDTAEKLGLTRQTVCDWRNHNPAFATELQRKRDEYWGGPQGRLQTLAYDAITRLEWLMKDTPDWDRATQLRILTTILKLSGLPARQPAATPAGPVAAGFPGSKDPPAPGASPAEKAGPEPVFGPAPPAGGQEEPPLPELTEAEKLAMLERLA